MSGGYLGTDTGLAHRHNGIAEAYNIHALFKHARRKFLSCARIVEHNRHYRVRARQHVKAELAKLAAEEGGVFMLAEASKPELQKELPRKLSDLFHYSFF